MHDVCHYVADILIGWEIGWDQSEVVLQSDLVHHRFRSKCQQIDNLCFPSMFNIDLDQVLIIECFYKCVTLEIQIC